MENKIIHLEYEQSLSKYIKDCFVYKLVPENFLPCIHRYNSNVLTDLDLKRLRHQLPLKIREDVNVELLDLLTKYKGWFQCVLDVLRDRDIKQPDVAQHLEELKRVHDEKWNAENLQSCEVTPVTESIPCQSANSDVNASNTSEETKVLTVVGTNESSGNDDSLTLAPPLNDSSDSDDGVHSDFCANDSHTSFVNHSLTSDCGFSDSLSLDSVKSPFFCPASVTNDSAISETVDRLTNLSITDGELEWSTAEGKGKCLVCAIELTSEQHMHQHLTGRNHKKRLQRCSLDNQLEISASPIKSFTDTDEENPKYCHICDLSLTSLENARQHYDGRNHKKKVDSVKLNAAVATPKDLSEPAKANKLADLLDPNFCHVCNVSFTSPEHAKQHYDGKNHKKKVEATKLSAAATTPKNSLIAEKAENELADSNDPSFCHVCNIGLTSPEHAKQHYEGKNHKKKMVARSITLPKTELKDSAVAEVVDNDVYWLDASGKGQCKVCSVSFTSKQLAKEHLDGSNHKKKLAQKQGN